ncbi:Oidioi.mRNA.OKI2018_I69.chr2.g4103.t1.cds [Oikopleura dioica]|uniref:Oidioi.mRNA.OKI2018_I69.chr2.g4103.t1.cds n=1 Tax=Oikopleura dioica TaxID=34765 RepID=A0ABN7SZR2_OIKDI|nr:Oidioi.mRNA.OKI2018_I69.chr2.g4103.t1.cds [Oikopleura dioica]
MGKDIAEKYAGKWRQESVENLKELNKKLGLPKVARKIAKNMEVKFEIIPEESSLKFKMKTKIITKKSSLPYSGEVFEDEGMNGEKIQSTLSFDGEDMIIVGKGIKAGDSLKEMKTVFKLIDGKLHLEQTIDDVTATRIMKRKEEVSK